MVRVDEAVVARLKTHGENFEIVVDCENALKLREGKAVDIADVLAAEKIFSDQAKGMVASQKTLETVFGTSDVNTIATKIITKGEINLTADYRKRLREQKLKAIMETIHRNAVDPQSGLPHPMKRLELALNGLHFKVDEFKPAETQIQDVLAKLREVLPIRFELRQIEVHIPAHEAEKSHKLIARYGRKIKDGWNADGSYTVLLEIPAGLQSEFFEYVDRLTNGNNETKVLETKGVE